MSTGRTMTNAVSEIVKILRELEESTGQKVEDIALYSLDITNFGGSVQQKLQSVRIEMARPVATRWAE